MSAAADSSAPPPCRRFNYRRSQRGYTLLWLVILLAGGATIYRGNQLVHEAADRQIKQESRTAEKMSEAKRALADYLLFQSNRFVITKSSAQISSRYLQFPCPDNAGEHDTGGIKRGNLDGVPDEPCGVDSRGSTALTRNHLTNWVLRGGSRFGRLPWKSDFDLGIDNRRLGFNNPKLLDASGNRLWYAVSRNVAPRKNTNDPIPLNPHYLSLLKEEWLTVRDETGGIISNRVMAAMLSPGPIIGAQKRYPESLVEKLTITITDSKIADTPLGAENFFEAVYATITIGEDEVVTLLANYDRDGDFVQSRRGIITSAYQFENTDGEIETIHYAMNDQIAYLSLDELIRPRGEFMRNFEGYLGINPKVQNAPLRNSPLAQLKTAAEGFYSAFGFYPNPAPINEDNAGTRNRHCGAYHTITDSESVGVPDYTSTEPMTVSIIFTSFPPVPTEIAILHDVTFSYSNTVTVTIGPVMRLNNGIPEAVSVTITSTMSRSTTFMTGATISINNPGPLVSGELPTLSPPVTLALDGILPGISFTAASFNLPTDFTAGFWPEHDSPPMTLASSNRNMNFAAETNARFLLTAAMTKISVGSVVTVTLTPEVKIVFPRGSKLKTWDNKDNLSGAKFPAGTYAVQDGATISLGNAVPTRATFLSRQLAVIAGDIITGSGFTLTASSFLPWIIYPWRTKAKVSDAKSRDNLHPYPPCWNSHDFFDERFRAFIEDFPTYYAVGNSESITVEIDPGITFAMPRAHRINIGATATIFLREGDLPPPRDNGGELRIDGGGNMAYQRKNGGSFSAVLSGQFTLSPPILIDFGDARISLAQPLIIAPGDILTFPKDTAFIADSAATISQVDALMIFSPGPLSRVNCDSHGDNCISQTRPTAALDAADVRAYLDNAENTDGDSVFTINRRRIKKNAPQFNDHFLLFGGRVDNSKLDPL